MKIVFKILLLVQFCVVGYSQNEENARQALEQINSLDQKDSLKKLNPEWTITIRNTPEIGFFSDSIITHAEIGEICKTSDINNSGIFIHKIISRKKEEHCKVKIIFFHGTDRTIQELDSLRTLILQKYKSGIDFTELHKEYNEDGNPTGILDWFCKGVMVKDFENAVWNSKKNEIFKVDVPSLEWYFIVLKIEKNQMKKATHSINIKLE